MKITRVEQRTEDWYKIKKGKVGGSTFKNVFKSNNLDFIDELIAQLGNPEIEETFTSNEMQRGIELEPLAVDVYQKVTGIKIEDSFNLCTCDWSDLLVLSPDGFTPELNGAIEIKCPNTKTHVRYIRQNKIPSEYKYQVYAYFIVNHMLEWLDFVSFDPRFEPQQMWIKRVTREEIQGDLDNAKAEMVKFEEKYNRVINSFRFDLRHKNKQQ